MKGERKCQAILQNQQYGITGLAIQGLFLLKQSRILIPERQYPSGFHVKIQRMLSVYGNILFSHMGILMRPVAGTSLRGRIWLSVHGAAGEFLKSTPNRVRLAGFQQIRFSSDVLLWFQSWGISGHAMRSLLHH